MTAPALPLLSPQTPARDYGDSSTLSGEHARLMRDVARRAASVLTLLDARTWPHAELGALTNHLRSEVLRQVSDEEVHLYPHDSSAPPFAELSADHVRLHSLAAQLEQAHASPCSRTHLRALVEELLATLRRHFDNECRVLAAATAAWLPDPDTPVRIELDSMAPDQAMELSVERLLRLRPGQAAELHASDAHLLRGVGRWLQGFDAARFGFDDTSVRRDHLLRVTCRQGNGPVGIGYPG